MSSCISDTSTASSASLGPVRARMNVTSSIPRPYVACPAEMVTVVLSWARASGGSGGKTTRSVAVARAVIDAPSLLPGIRRRPVPTENCKLSAGDDPDRRSDERALTAQIPSQLNFHIAALPGSGEVCFTPPGSYACAVPSILSKLVLSASMVRPPRHDSVPPPNALRGCFVMPWQRTAPAGVWS